SPINKQVGDTVALNMMVDPGVNMVSSIKFQVKYDPTKLTISTTNPFTLNTEAFPAILEGPILASGLLGETVSIGADGTKAIQAKVKVGTVNFTAAGSTNGTSTLVSFTNLTQAVSIGPNDNAYQSVLASTTPATIVIGGSSNATPTIGGPPITITPPVTPPPTVTVTPPVGGSLTTASFTILLHGIGSTGDNPNPQNGSLSNKTPLHPQRRLEVQLSDINNRLVASASGAINYDSPSGAFKGSIALAKNITKGKYSIKVKTPRYLRKRIPGIFEITPNKDNQITDIDLVAGDTNNDNSLDILDYNAYLDCGYGSLDPLPVDDANSLFNKKVCQAHVPSENIDTDDNGIVDSADYNLFLRELSVQSGD
ncbi:MAG TPA: cohesin domain-containing protein, partial [Xanthomonadales bacterium]|nr:cohesin domain-containing protein [Xanthomonadales bacterium]